MSMDSNPKFSLKNIRSDFIGYSQIAELANNLSQSSFSKIELDLSHMDWCDGNMCSPLGAVLYKASRNLNNIKLNNLFDEVEKILCGNGFLTNYGRAKLSDIYSSTIQYRQFGLQEDRAFNYYLDEQLRNKAIPEMSDALHRKFLEGLMEIFNNSVIHSNTKYGIFVCGQYYHQQKRLDFTITDLGVGICQNLSEKIGLKLPADEAINWAMEGNNTTKRGQIPGGLGLKLLREFIKLNNGKLQIVSANGYWEQFNNGDKELKLMNYKFPGTVVNIEINTANQNSYQLLSEQEDEIPF
ncbi:MAG: ATP-binding protein [Chloroflexi bacterium]|nr:ATP-binding protein [Chloroflexota bacterium]